MMRTLYACVYRKGTTLLNRLEHDDTRSRQEECLVDIQSSNSHFERRAKS